MRRALAIGRVGVVRTLRDRSNLISMLAVPLIIVLILGIQFGSESEERIAISGGSDLAEAVAASLERSESVELTRAADPEEVSRQVSEREISLGVIADGEQVEVLVRDTESSAALRPLVTAALNDAAREQTVEQALLEAAPGLDRDRVAGTVAGLGAQFPATEVAVEAVGEGGSEQRGGQFGQGAAQQLTLMVFLFALFSSLPMIQSRALGVTTRMLSTPTSPTSVVLGEGAARFGVASFQAIYIVVATTVFFGVGWGSLPVTAAVMLAFCAAGAGAGLFLGSLVDDEGVALGLSLLVGLGLAALGGAMLPAEFFTPAMATIADFIPHQWALEGLAAAQAGDGFGAVLPQLAALLGTAAVLVILAGWLMRRRLYRPAGR